MASTDTIYIATAHILKISENCYIYVNSNARLDNIIKKIKDNQKTSVDLGRIDTLDKILLSFLLIGQKYGNKKKQYCNVRIVTIL